MHCRFCCYGLGGQEAQIAFYQPQLPGPHQTGTVHPIHVANQSCQSCQLPPYLISYLLNQNCPILDVLS